MGIIRKVKHIEDCSLGGVAQVLPIFTICERMSSEFNFSYDSKYAVYRYDRRGGLTGGGGGECWHLYISEYFTVFYLKVTSAAKFNY